MTTESDFDELVKLIQEGRTLKSLEKPVLADSGFDLWLHNGTEYLLKEFGAELAAQWQAMPDSSCVVRGGHYYDDYKAWDAFHNIIDQRVMWLGGLPKRLREEASSLEKVQKSALEEGRREIRLQTTARAFIDPSRIEQMRRLASDEFDFSKVIRFCEELNVSFATESYFAVAMLGRALVDHVPPVFQQRTFGEVANNYPGTSSFKASMQTLDRSLRNIADQHLHAQIRPSETLPNARQVDFGNDLDVLLSEMVRLHQRRGEGAD